MFRFNQSERRDRSRMPTWYLLFVALENKMLNSKSPFYERGGVVLEHRTPRREVMGSISTGDTVLCALARHINYPEYWLNQWKHWLRPNMTEKLLTGTLRMQNKNK